MWKSKQDVANLKRSWNWMRNRPTGRTARNAKRGPGLPRNGSKRKSMSKATYHSKARLGHSKHAKRSRRTRTKVPLAKRVRTLERNQPKQAVREVRNMDAWTHINAANQCAYSEYPAFDNALIESVLDDLPYVDRATTPALDTVDLRNQGLELNLGIRDIYSKITARNNYAIPVIADLYMLQIKNQSDIADIATMLNTADDQLQVATASTNVMTHPSDFKLFNETFKVLKHQKATLDAGDEFVMTYTRKNHSYDTEYVDDLSNPTYYKGNIAFLLRTQGVVAHDATTDTNVGLGDGQLDVVLYRKFKLYYDGDAPFRTINITNSLDTVAAPETAGPAVGADHAD